MAADKKLPGDSGSQIVEEMRLQLNRLTAFAEAVKAAAVTDGDTFQTNVAALTEDADFENILTRIQMPPAPKLDTGS